MRRVAVAVLVVVVLAGGVRRASTTAPCLISPIAAAEYVEVITSRHAVKSATFEKPIIQAHLDAV